MPKTQHHIVTQFDIRGIGSLFYLALVIDSNIPATLSNDLVNATLPTIALSVLLHNISTTPLITLYQKRRVTQEREKRRRQHRDKPPRQDTTKNRDT